MSEAVETSVEPSQHPAVEKEYRHKPAGDSRSALRRFFHRSDTAPLEQEFSPEEQGARAATSRALEELGTELSFERREVLAPLFQRLQDLSDRLEHGEPIPPKVLHEGLDLWQAYVDRLHDPHIAQMVTIDVANTGLSGSEQTLAEIEKDPPRAQGRIGEVRAMLAAYEDGYRVFGGLMSPTLHGNTLSELAWEELEERFLRTWTPRPLTAVGLQKLTSSLTATHKAAEELRRRVQGFIERTLSFGPAGAGASANMQASGAPRATA
jgi:hypothetical protein